MLTLLLAVATLANQDWQSQGKIDSRDIKIERRTADGNGVEGTEFVHYEYRVSLQVVPAGQFPDFNSIINCDSVCKGKKHKDHSECDTSCDDQCKTVHHVSIKGFAARYKEGMRKMEKESAKIAKGIGMPGGPDNWSSATSNALRNLENEAKGKKVTLDPPHLRTPCALTTRYYGWDVKNVNVKGEFWKVGYYQTRGVKTPINELIKSQEGMVMQIYEPVDKEIHTDVVPACKCKVVPQVPPEPKYGIGRTPTFSGLGWRGPDGKVTIPDDKKVRVITQGGSLTKIAIIVQNESGEAYEVIIPAGTKFVPKDGGTQTMASIGDQKCSVPSKSTTLIQVSTKPEPTRFLQTSAEIRVACTELAKHAPSEASVFTIQPPDNPLLSKICSVEDRGYFASTIAQARVWIYTDAASMADINKILRPGVTDGLYLNAMFGLGGLCNVDLNTPRYKKLLEPELLAAATASRSATEWYAALLHRIDPSDSFGKKAVAKMKSSMAAKTEAIDVRHAAHMAIALSDSDNKETRLSALDLMEKSIPDALKKEFLAEGGLGVLKSILTFGDEDECSRAIQVAKKYAGPETKQMLEGFAYWGRESIRAAAESAAAGM